MKRERESMRESEEVREKTRVRMILNRSPCFYTGVNRIGSVRPVWFTPKTWMPTVWSRIGSLGQSDGLCCSLWPRIRLSLGLGLKPVHFLCFTYFVLFSYHCLIITPLPCLECLKKNSQKFCKDCLVFFFVMFLPQKSFKKYIVFLCLTYEFYVEKTCGNEHDFLISILDICLWLVMREFMMNWPLFGCVSCCIRMSMINFLHYETWCN
jgi:hypothetical protein